MLYKLTDENGCTKGETQWGAGVTHGAKGAPDQPLCSDGWIHAYESALLAVLLNPIHANFTTPQLWEAHGRIGIRDGQLKCGCRSLTTLRRIELPPITLDQRVRFAIACTWLICTDTQWRAWATDWLSGADRTAEAAWTAAAEAAWTAAAEAAAWVAPAWALAAEAAARALAAEAAEAAAEAAARAARAAAAAAADIDFLACANWAITDKPITELYPENDRPN